MKVRCDFCGLDFEAECSQQACTGCPLAQGCQRITCPRCGYVMPAEASLVRWLRALKEAWQQHSRTNF